ncbi:MAG: hypothetical protein OXD01_02975 [Gammaproteobacteria bacterium]|nr:hypothetical protein [Gammaproteobacteria bacterium]
MDDNLRVLIAARFINLHTRGLVQSVGKFSRLLRADVFRLDHLRALQFRDAVVVEVLDAVGGDYYFFGDLPWLLFRLLLQLLRHRRNRRKEEKGNGKHALKCGLVYVYFPD